MKNLFAVALIASVFAGCVNPQPKRVFTQRADQAEIVFSSPGVRTIDLAKANEIDDPFEVKWENEWERPWTFVISFDYRTVGVTGDAVALLTQPLKDDGSRAPTQLWPDTFTGRREDTYVLAESADFRNVVVDVQLPNIIRKNYRFEWQKRFGTQGKVEVKNFKVTLVRRAVHTFKGGEYEIKQTKYFCLKNIFFDDYGEVDVDFAFPELNPVCCVLVKNVKGEVLRTVEGENGKAHLNFPTRGFWDLEAIAEYPDGTKISTPGVVSVCGRPISHELVKNSRYGIMIVLGTPDLWEKLGSRWDQRVMFPDTMKNSFELYTSTYDAFFLFLHEITPKDLRKPEDANKQGAFPPEDWDAFREFCGTWIDAQPDVLERNISLTGELDFQWRGTDEEYVKMCRIFTEEARKRNPDFFATGPGASRIKLDYFERLHELGFFDFLSGINIHHYVDGTKPESEYWEDFIAMFDFFKEAEIDKPIYITETGWTVGKGYYFVAVTPENQARYLTRAMALMSTENIKAIIWHVDFTMLDEFGAIRKSNEAAFPKPMLQAFATVTRNLTDVQGNMTLHRLGPQTYLTSGKKEDGRWVHVYWRSSGDEEVALPVKNVTSAEDYLGTPVKYGDTLKISEDPVYIFSDGDYLGPEWKAPPGGVKPIADVQLKTDWEIEKIEPGVRSAAKSKEIPTAMWSDPRNAPKMKIAYARDVGFVIEVEVKDAKHYQPYTHERYVEGDSMTFAFDVDKTSEWHANDIWMTYKGHRCVEYSVALGGNGKSAAYRRNCWIPDMKKFTSVGANVRTSVRHENGLTKYWVWIPWANLGLDEQLRPGTKIGFSAVLYASDGKEVSTNRLFDGIVAPLDPMKYGVMELK